MDIISRFHIRDLRLRAYTSITTDTVRSLIDIHATTPSATRAFGRAITATALLGATLKPDSAQTITLKFSGSGPIREVHVQSDARGNIRGYVSNPAIDGAGEIRLIEFSRLIGAGMLTITKDIGLREPYTSVMPLLHGDISRDLASYLATSEQTPSALIIGLAMNSDGTIASSGGILVQTFPDTTPDVVERVETSIAGAAQPLGEFLRGGGAISHYLSGLLGGAAAELLAETTLSAACRCNRALIGAILQSLGEDELRDMIEKDGGAELACLFCRQKYHFSADDLRAIVTNSAVSN